MTQAAAAKMAKAAAKSARSCATPEKKARSAWNQLRANLRHADESNRGVVIDEDDDDGDEPDLTTVSIWDDFNDDGSTSDTREAIVGRSTGDEAAGNGIIVGVIRKSRGPDGGTERPPRG